MGQRRWLERQRGAETERGGGHGASVPAANLSLLRVWMGARREMAGGEEGAGEGIGGCLHPLQLVLM